MRTLLFLLLLAAPVWAQNAATQTRAEFVPAPDGESGEPREVIEGTVLDEHGKPVGGAWVKPFTGTGVALQPAASDANGRFAVGYLPPMRTPSGFFVLRAERDGFPDAFAAVSQFGDERATLRFWASQPLRVKVQSEDGQPIRGALVTPVSRAMARKGGDGIGALPAFSMRGLAPVSTGETGEAIFAALPAQGFIELKVAHPDWASDVVVVALPRAKSALVELERAASVEGRVFLGQEPMLGLPLQIKMQTASGLYARQGNWRFGEVNPQDGSFRVANLPSLEKAGVGRYDFQLEHVRKHQPLPGGATYEFLGGFTGLLSLSRGGRRERWASFYQRNVTFEKGQTLKRDLHLVPYSFVSGSVPASERTRGPVQFSLRDPRGAWAFDRFQSDRSGAFSRAIPTGAVSLSVERGGKRLGYLNLRALKPHEEREVEWTLEQTPLSASVEEGDDEEGEPRAARQARPMRVLKAPETFAVANPKADEQAQPGPGAALKPRPAPARWQLGDVAFPEAAWDGAPLSPHAVAGQWLVVTLDLEWEDAALWAQAMKKIQGHPALWADIRGETASLPRVPHLPWVFTGRDFPVLRAHGEGGTYQLGDGVWKARWNALRFPATRFVVAPDQTLVPLFLPPRYFGAKLEQLLENTAR